MKDETFTQVVRVGVIEQRPNYEMDRDRYAAYMRGRPTVDPPWWHTEARRENAEALRRCVVQRGTTDTLVDAGDHPPTHALMRTFRKVTTSDGTFNVPVGPYWIEALASEAEPTGQIDLFGGGL